MPTAPRRHWLALAAPVALAAAGCVRPPPPVAPTKPPEVVVDLPVVRTVTDYEDFTGRTEQSDRVDIKPHVTGYVAAVHFSDGQEVTAGQPLFDIDPGTYAADVAKAKAEVAKAEAQVVQAEATVNRIAKDDVRLKKLGLVAVSQEELDRVEGQLREAQAGAEVARRSRESAERQQATAELYLGYTHVASPVTGRIGRRLIDRGNLATADVTTLASVVAVDPLYVNFDVDDATILKLNRLVAGGAIRPLAEGKTIVRVGLPDEEGFSVAGAVRFVDTAVNSGTGTIKLRAEVRNPDPRALLAAAGSAAAVGPDGRKADAPLVPGLFVRARLPVGLPRRAVLVPEEAVGTDQGLKFVYVLNAADEVVMRRVVLGQPDGRLRVVESGVGEGERVIVQGLQRVRPGVKVAPKTLAELDPKAGR